MFFLILTIITGSMVALVIRASQGRVKGRFSMMAANYLTALTSAMLWMGVDKVIPQGEGAGLAIGMGAVNGVFYAGGILLMQYNVQKNGVVMPSAFSRLGALMVPLTLSVAFFGEMPRTTQILGVIVAVGAILAVNYDKNQVRVTSKALLLVLMLNDGCATSMSKIFGEVGASGQTDRFVFCTFCFAFLISVGLLLKNKERPGLPELGFGILLGLPNFLATRFLLMALERMPAFLAYPIRGVGGILFVTLAGVVFFGERLKKRQWMALGAICAALVLLNI